jgi:MraZ protein
MFLGEYRTKFSGAGRIILPKKFRKELSGFKEIVLCRGFEECIWGYNTETFKKEAEKQLSVPATEREARFQRRYLFSGAEETLLDAQGRFVIPKSLLGYAGLKNEVVLIGTGDHFEIWKPAKWDKILKSILKQGRS